MELHFKPEPRACFYNAQRLALARGLRYFEGNAKNSKDGRSHVHAWCEDDQGQIIDITPGWDNGEGSEYSGVEVPQSELLQIVARNAVGRPIRVKSEAEEVDGIIWG